MDHQISSLCVNDGYEIIPNCKHSFAFPSKLPPYLAIFKPLKCLHAGY